MMTTTCTSGFVEIITFQSKRRSRSCFQQSQFLISIRFHKVAVAGNQLDCLKIWHHAKYSISFKFLLDSQVRRNGNFYMHSEKTKPLTFSATIVTDPIHKHLTDVPEWFGNSWNIYIQYINWWLQILRVLPNSCISCNIDKIVLLSNKIQLPRKQKHVP